MRPRKPLPNDYPGYEPGAGGEAGVCNRGGGLKMKEYTYSEARQRFSSVLDSASREGAVRVRRKDGTVYVIRPEQKSGSPFEVEGINLTIDRTEIVDFIVEGRRKSE
jgi:hypothetical protein